MNVEKYMPCPFCGALDLIVSESDDSKIPGGNPRYREYVICGQCGTCGPWGEDEDDAILKWNKQWRWKKLLPYACDVEPDRLYAVLVPSNSGVAVACVMRGADCNWKSSEIAGYWPMPMLMSEAVARKFQRTGELDSLLSD